MCESCFETVDLIFMEANNQSGIIPEGNSGKDITVETEKVESDLNTARQTYQKAKGRLLDINHWSKLTGSFLANFQRVDADGAELEGNVKKGDYIKIDIPGPGTDSGEGNDWVYVEEIMDDENEGEESIGFRVKPVSNPTRSDDDSISHFYSSGSSSSFTVTRKLERIMVGIYDKNIEVNTESDSGLDKARNAVYGAIAKTFFSKIQWKLLAEGILSE